MIQYSLGQYTKKIEEEIRALGGKKLIERFWKRDASLWKSEPDRQKLILDRLGWLDVAEKMLANIDEINEFVNQIKKDKFTFVVLLGMGGSSLCPDVLHQIFGVKKGYPKFYMLDSTDPEAVVNVEKKINLKKTLFIFSSKSGGTIEPSSQYKYFWDKLSKLRKNENIGDQFCVITDPGTSLQHLGQTMRFRKIFLNPPDIGGRYSALSYFGLVPAALMGIDIKTLLKDAEQMKKHTQDVLTVEKNQAVYLGVILGELAKQGIDKATFLIPGKLSAFGYWVEQLIAESTGKEGRGVIPVEGETIENPDIYGKDRVFITMGLKGESNKGFEKKVTALKKAGFPVIEITLNDKYNLGGEFFRWELATAIIGAVLKIDPFDQPNVQAAKDITGKILDGFKKKGKFDIEPAKLESKGIKVYYDDKVKSALQKRLAKFNGKPNKLEDVLTGFLSLTEANDYVVFLAYLAMTDSMRKRFDKIRKVIRHKLHVSTIQGFGPRYLHSIGQLYKGGPNTGVFIEITVGDQKDLKIPNEKYTFGQLKTAQALGDFQALQSDNRRVIRIDLGKDYLKNYAILEKALGIALGRLYVHQK